MNEIKQVIVMRTDLNMRKGKMIAQGAHASMKFLLARMKSPWENSKARPAIALNTEPYNIELNFI